MSIEESSLGIWIAASPGGKLGIKKKNRAAVCGQLRLDSVAPRQLRPSMAAEGTLFAISGRMDGLNPRLNRIAFVLGFLASTSLVGAQVAPPPAPPVISS